jgi:hypothetical protein
MYARQLAMFGLLCVSASIGLSESNSPATSEVEVYLKGDAGSSPDVIGEMNRELAALMQGTGFHIVWRHAHDRPSSGSVAHLIVVELRGTCAVPPVFDPSDPHPSPLALASTAVVDGRVLPFSWVDCAALSRFLEPAISGLPDAEQSYVYGRSMARLLAHEFYHVLAQTDDHTQIGISKARLSIADLLSEHLNFESVALDKLRIPSPGSGGDDPSVGGR